MWRSLMRQSPKSMEAKSRKHVFSSMEPSRGYSDTFEHYQVFETPLSYTRRRHLVDAIIGKVLERGRQLTWLASHSSAPRPCFRTTPTPVFRSRSRTLRARFVCKYYVVNGFDKGVNSPFLTCLKKPTTSSLFFRHLAGPIIPSSAIFSLVPNALCSGYSQYGND